MHNFLLSVIALAFVLSSPWSIQSEPIRFGESITINNFPDSLRFKTSIESSEGDVTEAWLLYYVRSELSTTSTNRIPLEFAPDARVEVSYDWVTEGETVQPGMPLVYWWEAQNENGDRARSEEQFVRYEDVRFDWQVFEEGSISIWLHDHSYEFGERVFELAKKSVQEQEEFFGSPLRFPVRLMVYNDQLEFAAFQAVPSGNIGGLAYTGYGITLQIVPASPFRDYWLNDVIPHEISHLYFAQATFHPMREGPPSWLDEGTAMMNQNNSQIQAIERARAAAERGDLIPLTALSGSFGVFDGAKFRLSYDESFSAVYFFLEEFGLQALHELIASYREGMTTDEAFRLAIGMDLGEFQDLWASWLGMLGDFVPTPTKLVYPTYAPAPTSEFQSVATPGVQVDEVNPHWTESATEPANESPAGICYTGAIPILAALAVLGLWRKRA